MKRGVIVGEIWATRRAGGLDGRSLKLVAELPPSVHPDPAAAAQQAQLAEASLVVAIDTLDARSGQEVLVAFGSGARNVLQPGPHNRHLLCDAAVALLVDRDAASDDDSAEPPR